jgi:hypothetical protein
MQFKNKKMTVSLEQLFCCVSVAWQISSKHAHLNLEQTQTEVIG